MSWQEAIASWKLAELLPKTLCFDPSTLPTIFDEQIDTPHRPSTGASRTLYVLQGTARPGLCTSRNPEE